MQETATTEKIAAVNVLSSLTVFKNESPKLLSGGTSIDADISFLGSSQEELCTGCCVGKRLELARVEGGTGVRVGK